MLPLKNFRSDYQLVLLALFSVDCDSLAYKDCYIVYYIRFYDNIVKHNDDKFVLHSANMDTYRVNGEILRVITRRD